MLTTEYCEVCEDWRIFNKNSGKYERKDLPWYCIKCEWETMEFPRHPSPIAWVRMGRRPEQIGSNTGD